MTRRGRFYTWVQEHPLVPDIVIAGGLFGLLVLPFAGADDSGSRQLALGAAIYGSLVFRRVRPVESFALVAATGLVQWAAGVDLSPGAAGVLLAVYSISAYGPRWAGRAGLAVGILGAVLASQRFVLVQGGAGAFFTGVAMYGAAVVGVWALGDVRRVRYAYINGLVDRARQAERERDQQAQLAAAGERARIAREMHDVVAHNLSVIVAQADGGRYAAEADAGQAVGALETIAATGRSALAEMRRLLGVLRAADEDPAEPAPQPDLTRLPELVESFRDAGLPVELQITGASRRLPDGPSLAVYRAIQEALTNVLKHAGQQASTSVTVSLDADRLTAEVTDDGRVAAPSPPGSGHGLAGMRERLALYGGDADAGPIAGGWRVAVSVPVEQESGQ